MSRFFIASMAIMPHRIKHTPVWLLLLLWLFAQGISTASACSHCLLGNRAQAIPQQAVFPTLKPATHPPCHGQPSAPPPAHQVEFSPSTPQPTEAECCLGADCTFCHVQPTLQSMAALPQPMFIAYRHSLTLTSYPQSQKPRLPLPPPRPHISND